MILGRPDVLRFTIDREAAVAHAGDAVHAVEADHVGARCDEDARQDESRNDEE